MNCRNFLAASAAACAVMLGTAVAQGPGSSPEMLEEVRNSWIFTFKDNFSRAAVPSEASAAVAREGGQLKHVYRNSIKGFSAKMSEQAARNLVARNPNVVAFEADGIAYIVQGRGKPPKDDGGGQQPPQEVPYGITRVNGPVNGAGKVAWVIDTGVQQDHPDLNVDTARSANFVSKGKSSVNDGNGHGTHVAGTIAAIDNDIGVVGVAAGASVVGIRVLNNRGSGTYSDIIAGVDYVAANASAGDVANMSLGGGPSSSLDNAILAAADQGIRFSLAAGNEAQDANNVSPARIGDDHPNVYTVSAIDSNDNFASFSNFGTPVYCAAPGVGVQSTYPESDYRSLSGTSMAAPHVAGILLFGAPGFNGNANGDPDIQDDPICVY